MNIKNQRIFSGVQPSGNLHIGNYLGAIKQFVELQKNYEAIFCVVDLHAITVPQDPTELRKNTLSVAMLYLAAGIDPKKSIVFVQSHVPAHTELAWILNTLTRLGELERMTQYKEKKGKNGVCAGLLNYPVLMASDILLYKTNLVPVGEDQKQHVEFARMIAEKFNNRFGETFVLPKELIRKETARIMGLDDPTKKMSKSAESKNNYIGLLDSPDEIRRKIKIAVTDSDTDIRYEPEKRPGVSNLLAIYSEFSGMAIPKIEKGYSGKGYAEFKKDLGELLVEKLCSLQSEYHKLKKDKNEVIKILHEGAEKASLIAEKTLKELKEKVGFLLK